MGNKWDESVSEYAAYWGCLDGLKYAHENECPWGENTCEWAAKIWGPWILNSFTTIIINNGLHCLMYAHKNGAPCDLGCNSTTWCEYRCDFCWHRNCDKHDSAKSFRMIISEMDHILYKDVVDVICSFI